MFYESVENPFHKRCGNQKNIALRGTSKGFTLMVKQKIKGPALLAPSSTQSKMAQIFWEVFLFYDSVENPFHKRCGNQKNIALRGTSNDFTLMVKQKIMGPALLDPSSTQSKMAQIFWAIFLFYESVENPFHKRCGNQKNVALRGTSNDFTLMVKQKIKGPALLDPSSTQSKMAQYLMSYFNILNTKERFLQKQLFK